MPSCPTICPLLALLLLLCSLITTNATLFPSEQAALSDILKYHPDLSSVPAWESLDYNNVYYGRSWVPNFSSLCQSDGYDFYGVYCVDGHVGGLRVTNYWGKSFDGDYSASEGLQFLTNYTDTATSPIEGLFSILSDTVPLVHVDTVDAELSNFTSPSSLVSLSGKLPSYFSFVGMTNLQSLRVGYSNVTQDADEDFSPLCNSGLKELDYAGTNFTKFADLVNCLPLIEKAVFRSSYDYTAPPNITLDAIDSSHLKSLSIQYLNFIPSSIRINTISLVDLDLNIPGNVTFDVNAPALKSLSISSHNLPASLTSFTKLESFSWSCLSQTREIPSLSFAPNLRSVDLIRIVVANANINDVWATFPAQIEMLNLAEIQFSSGVNQIISFPTNWTSLTSLSISYPPAQQTIDGSNIQSLTSLKELNLFNIYIPSLEHFYVFPNLSSLSFNFGWGNLAMQIPPDFFVRMSQLTSLSLVSSTLYGAIPWRGWGNLEYVLLFGSMTSWPSIEGSASRLKSLSIISNELTMIPTDLSFKAANMQNLRYLTVYSAALKSAPFFWTDLPNLQTVYLLAGGYMGPFQSPIAAPRLSQLYMDRSFCGPLPDFNVPTHLIGLSATGNLHSGPIPVTWEDNLSILTSLDLSGSLLNGTIPPHFLDHHAGYRANINLQGNDFTGPIWNMSMGVPAVLNFASTGLDICAQDPDIQNVTVTSLCLFTSVPRCPSSCPSYWTTCRSATTCIANPNFIPRAPSPCFAPNEICPLPQPGTGFQCNRGTWIYIGTPSLTLTLPPSAGPVFIFGNLSTNGTITFTGTGTSLEVQGCVVEAPSLVVIELPPGTDPDPVTLIVQHEKNCGTDLSQIPITLSSIQEGCKKTKVASPSTPASLTAVFTIEDLCTSPESSKKKWIILGSVIGGTILLLTVIGVLLTITSPRFRTLFRTCSIRKALSAK